MKMEDMSLSGLDNTKLEALAHDIYSDLVEDACLGLCFEVHRAVKQGYFFLDDTDQESMKDFEIVDQPGVDIFGQVYNQWKNKECVCPNCSRSIAASRFAPHLEKCLGMGRNSSRIANRRLTPITFNSWKCKSGPLQGIFNDFCVIYFLRVELWSYHSVLFCLLFCSTTTVPVSTMRLWALRSYALF
uniref:Ataxin-7-like protein 3 n=1 Tax=Astyanax mexicanus TaxID=7994 RepID=A0A8B9JGC4_ASTMX